MSDQLWSWVLGVVGVVGFILAGKKVWWAWYINLGCQALWLIYAYVTTQYGFIATAVVYTFVFFKNARLWTQEHFDKTRQDVAGEFNKKMQYNDAVETAEAIIASGPVALAPLEPEPKVVPEFDDEEEIRVALTGPIFFSMEELADTETMELTLDHLMSDIREDAFTLGTGYRVWFEETINGKFLHWEFA